MAFQSDLSENSVRYRLYGLNDTTDSLNESISQIYSHLAQHISDHIWHNQSFHLSVRTDSSGLYGLSDTILCMHTYIPFPSLLSSHPKGVHHLEGITNFGDNIDDEWLIVYLLYQLSRFDPNLVIKVEDSDGEFLLIEAADDLPKWCEPDNCLNRVYIFREAVHIIPLNCKAFANRIPSISEAIGFVRHNADTTRAQEKIQKAIDRRIKCFPKKMRESEHKSHCYVPIGVAALLRHNPSLISSAVNAFYNRTPDDLKACQAMKYFPPESRVMRCISFTRCLYAQLMSQSYAPDVKVGWNLPPNESKEFKSHDLGVKIASGFEILISNSKMSSNQNNNEIDFSSDRRWIAFHNSLIRSSYFGSELKGSQKYRERLRSAQNYFSDLIVNNESPEEFDCNESKGEKIRRILQSIEIDGTEFENEAKSLDNEDSDDWINVNSDELDALLSAKFCSTNQSTDCSQISTQIPATLKAFVSNQKSGLKGAEAPIPSRPNRINFNEEAFTDALSSVLSLKVPHSETGSSSSGMSDYEDEDESIDSDDDCYQNDFNRSEVMNNKTKVDEMKSYMNAMDRQLAETPVGQSFERRIERNNESDAQNDNQDFKAVDIDMNALTNILESYGSECGVPGPATALFASMGVRLPDNTDKD